MHWEAPVSTFVYVVFILVRTYTEQPRLQAEEESLQRTQSDSHQAYPSYDDRTRKQPPKPSFDTRILGATMRTIGTNHKISRIPEDSVSYLALSLRARLQDLVTAMITAAHHRTDITFDRPATLYEDNSPMWSIVIKSDVAKQLAALEKVEREEETKIRKERKERADLQAAHAAALAAQANGASSASAAAGLGLGGAMAGAMGDGAGGAFGFDDQDGGGKKKRKKDGPGVTARNMSEDARKKMSNAVATQAAGLGGKYAWMTAANSASTAAPPKPKPPVAAAVSTTSAITTATAAGAAATTVSPTTPNPTGALSSWARPYVPTTKKTTSSKEESMENDTRTIITMRDAMFVIEKERGHGGGRGAARGWT